MMLPLIFLFLFPLVEATSNDHLYHQNLRNFMQYGITGILWSEVDFDSVNVSNDCKTSLRLTKEHFQLGSEWAHSVIDSSSKISPGMLKGTVGSFGDYDQCLEIEQTSHEPNFVGAYSVIQLEYVKRKDVYSNISLLMSETYPVLGVVNLHFAVCLPSTCSGSDVKSLVTKGLTGYPFKIPEKACYLNDNQFQIIPETKEDLFLSSKIKNFSRTQFVALAFISFVLALCFIAVFCPSFNNRIFIFIECFDPIRNTKDLFQVSDEQETSPNQIWVDCAKMSMIAAGVLAHSTMSVEHFIPLIVISRLNHGKYFWKEWIMQPLNEAGFLGLSVMCGYYHFRSFYRGMKEGKLNPVKVVIKKYLHFTLPIIGIMALDLIMPIYGSGSIYSYVSRGVVDVCEQYWWRHLLVIGNHGVERTCAGYMFMTSVTLQLMVIGLVLIYLLARRPRIGVSVSLIILAVSGNKFYQNSKSLSSPLAFNVPISVQNVVEYMKVSHFPLTPHLIAYTSGLLLTFFLENGFRVCKASLKNSILLFSFQVLLTACVIFSPGLHNVLNLIPPNMYPVFIVSIHVAYMSTVYQSLILSYHIPKDLFSKRLDSNNKPTQKERGVDKTVRSITNALLSISFSMAVVNYPVTRWDQIVSRTPLVFTDFYSLACRVFYSLQFVVMYGFLFQIFFVSPFEKMTKYLLHDDGGHSKVKKVK